MYLAATSDPCPPACDDADLRDRLWRQVRAAFPDVPGSALRLEQGGGDHLVLIADEARVFRFRHRDGHGLDLEVRLLRHLARHAPVRMPAYDLVAPDGRFASYPLIAGVPLTDERFRVLPADVARTAIGTAVKLLDLLHGTDPATLAPASAWPRMWSAGDFADRLQNDRLPTLAKRVPRLVAPIQAFLDRYREDRVPSPVVLHGDLVGDHLLVDADTGHLAGIIDFSDTALGDPAQDLLGFWAYGDGAAAQAIALYGGSATDPTLRTRSRHHFVRYEIDRLFEMIVDGRAAETITDHAARLAPLLAGPSTEHH